MNPIFTTDDTVTVTLDGTECIYPLGALEAKYLNEAADVEGWDAVALDMTRRPHVGGTDFVITAEAWEFVGEAIERAAVDAAVDGVEAGGQSSAVRARHLQPSTHITFAGIPHTVVAKTDVYTVDDQQAVTLVLDDGRGYPKPVDMNANREFQPLS